MTNDWTITDNYWDQPTSLNNAQAVPDEVDGTNYTIVISNSDPNVKNWVSTGGLNPGTASIRFQDLGNGSPTVSSKVVKLSELDDPGVLPPGAFIPADQPNYRADQIAARKAGFNNRFAPFPQIWFAILPDRAVNPSGIHPRRKIGAYSVASRNAATSCENCSTAFAGFGSGPVNRISVAPHATTSATGAIDAST